MENRCIPGKTTANRNKILMQIFEISTIVSLARRGTKHMMMKNMGYSISLQRFSFNFHLLRFVSFFSRFFDLLGGGGGAAVAAFHIKKAK